MTGFDFPMIQNFSDGSQARRDGPCDFWTPARQKLAALGPDDCNQADEFCAIQNGHLQLAIRLARRDALAGQGRAVR